MTYHTDNKVIKYVPGFGFLSFKTFGRKLMSGYNKYGRKIVNKGITAAKKNNQSKYGQVLKKEESKIGKLAGKQQSEKIIPATVDLAGSKIAGKITSLKGEEQQEQIEEEEEIIIPPHQRQKITDDLRLF